MNKLKLILLSLCLFALVTACKDTEDIQPAESQLNIHLVHVVDNDILQTGEIKYSNAFGNEYSVERLQYFISDFRFTKSDGSEVFINEVHYVDFDEQPSLVFAPESKVPAGDYSGLSFIFGLTKEKNVPGAFPDPPENNMEWPPALGSGYHYMKLEGKIDSAGVITNYQAHTGPTDNIPFFAEVDLTQAAFSANEEEKTIFIKMNINNWWTGPNTLDLHNMTMVMGNQEMQKKLKENAWNVFSFEPYVTIN